jgi:hypothetical protein
MKLWEADEVLTGIVEEMAGHVADYVGEVAQRCGLGPDFGVAVGGGMVRGAPHVGDAVRAKIITLFADAKVTVTSRTALDGAVLAVRAEARQLAGQAPG